MNYRKKYFKIYLWQVLSVLLGFAALFVVVPYISSNKMIYGIYSVCTSLTIFFSYADLGFLSSGLKYAAECYVTGDNRNEVKIIGFTSFIMVSIFSLLAIGVFFLGLYPDILIPELNEGSEPQIVARWLLFVLAVSCPIIIGQRLLNLIFTIRVEDYKFQRFNIIANIVRIISVFFFFGNKRYMIVEYYIFYQFINLLVVIFAFRYVKSHYGYQLKELLNSFCFDYQIFEKVKGLTLASLIMMVSSVIYFEFDQVVISNILGIEAVAIYAAALSVLQLVRTFSSIVFSPYTSRYNHFVGLNDYQGLMAFVKKMIILFAPILIIPILTLSIFSNTFISSWIGEQYADSAILVTFLVFSFVLNFVKDPISQYFIATERNKILIKYNILTPVIFWIGVFLLINLIGIESFAIMKSLAPLVTVIAYWFLVRTDFKIRGGKFLSFSKLLSTIIPSILLVFGFSWIFSHWMVLEHSKMALLSNIILMGLTVFFSLLLSIPFNSEMVQETRHYMSPIINRFFK